MKGLIWLALIAIIGHLIMKPEGVQLLDQLSFVYKDTYIVYGEGRRSERDLPVCEEFEACNLAHQRLWFTPIIERLCRCSRRGLCPTRYDYGNSTRVQHVSNRGQLQFCREQPVSQTERCDHGQAALVITQDERVDLARNSRAKLLCRCPRPNKLALHNVSRTERPTGGNRITSSYVCLELPKCVTWKTCGYVRGDTHEMYYTCSCPVGDICAFRDLSRPLSELETARLDLPFLEGKSYEAICTPFRQ